MVEANCSYLQELFLKAILKMVCSLKANIISLMEIHTRENIMKANSMAKVYINGQMENIIMALGKWIKEKVREYSNIPMVVCMLGHGKMI